MVKLKGKVKKHNGRYVNSKREDKGKAEIGVYDLLIKVEDPIIAENIIGEFDFYCRCSPIPQQTRCERKGNSVNFYAMPHSYGFIKKLRKEYRDGIMVYASNHRKLPINI